MPSGLIALPVSARPFRGRRPPVLEFRRDMPIVENMQRCFVLGDGGSGAWRDYANIAGAGGDVTSITGTVKQDGELGPTVWFDRTNDRGDLQWAGILRNQNGTIGAWVTPDNADSSEDCIYTEQNAGGTNGDRLIKTGGNQWSCGVRQANNTWRHATGGTVTANRLYHLVGVIDKVATEIHLWENGVNVANNTDWDGSWAPLGSPTLIGDYDNSGTFGWGGTIHMVAIWRKALREHEILEWYRDPWLFLRPRGGMVYVEQAPAAVGDPGRSGRAGLRMAGPGMGF